MFDAQDDYDFNPTEGSKLSSLFGASMDEAGASLMYTPPKEPKTMTQPPESPRTETSKPETAVLCAKVVATWKLNEGKYDSLGKHGLAIIGSQTQNSYEIIIYKEKNNILVREKLNPKFSLLNQNDSFSTFYTTAGDNWLLKFDSKSDQDSFSSKIAEFGGKTVDNAKSEPKKPIVEENSAVRADILSRMAKMGQQIIPDRLPKHSSTDLSDSELDDSKTERKPSPRKFKRPVTMDTSQQIVSTQLIPTPTQMYMSPTVSCDNFGFIVAQNTELKMNLSQIAAKLDQLLIGGGDSGKSSDNSVYKSRIKSLELKNENLTTELEQTAGKLSNFQRKETISSEEEQSRRDELIQTKLALDLALEGNKRAESQVSTLKDSVRQLEMRIEEQKIALESQEAMKGEMNALREREELLKRKVDDLEREKSSEKGKEKEMSDVIKRHMNEMYQNLVGNFPDGQQYSADDIQVVIAKSIKSLTYKLIQEIQ